MATIEVTVPDRYPLPHIQDFNAKVKGSNIFSKVDLVRAFHNIPVAPKNVHKTAIVTPFGLFEFPKMPFGLRNAAQTFQRFMNEVCKGLEFVFVYSFTHLKCLTVNFFREFHCVNTRSPWTKIKFDPKCTQKLTFVPNRGTLGDLRTMVSYIWLDASPYNFFFFWKCTPVKNFVCKTSWHRTFMPQI